MDSTAALPADALRSAFLRRTYTFAGLSIALSGLIAAGIYWLLGENGPVNLLHLLDRLPHDLHGIVLILGGIVILLVMLMLGILLFKWIENLQVPLGLILVGWVGFAGIGGILLSPLFYIAGFMLVLKVFLLTGLVFTATGLLASMIGIDLTRWGGQIFSIMIALILMGGVNLVIRSEWIELAWNYGGLIMWLVVAVYAHQMLAKLPMPTEEELEKGALTRLAIAGALLLYVIFYMIFLRLLILALAEKNRRRR